MIAKLRPYTKTIAALAIGLLGWATQVVTSSEAAITASEWIALATVILVSGGVYEFANEPRPT